jgi:signal transduction histidine kinase
VAAQLGLWLSNVTLYQQAEEERERLAALLEVTPDAVIAVGPAGNITLANKAAEPFLAVARDQASGLPAVEAVGQESVRQLLLGDVIQEQTEEIVLDNGQVWSALAREIWAGGWRSVGRVCVLWDISHYRKLDMLKSEFVATVSHDLRAPLTLMRGYGTMISMVGALNEQQKDFITKILDSIDSMSQLVENLLDLGRIEAGLGLEIETVHLPELIEDVLETYRPTAVNKRVSLEVDLPAVLEPMKADPTLLRQAIANLVDNAIKFTASEGRVQLRAEQKDSEMLFQVEDTGVGIAPADQARLFERFYRARRPESLKSRGSGLGLAIVKSIVEQHGGRVWVESKLGSGSTFTFVVPLDASTVVEVEPEE